MRRLRRILLNAATALSGVVCVICLFWWIILSHGRSFGFWRHADPEPLDVTWLGAPIWTEVLVTSLLPIARIVAGVLRGFGPLPPLPIHRESLCPACGYDLRATPERCPECGHQPSS